MEKFTIEVDAKALYDSLKNLESKMDEMISHQQKTNGRVTANEDSISSLKTFQTRALTIWAVVVTIGGIVINNLI